MRDSLLLPPSSQLHRVLLPGGPRHAHRPSMDMCVCSCSAVSESLQPYGLQPARLLCLWKFQGKNTGVSCHFLLQGIFPTQGSNLCIFAFLELAGRFFTTWDDASMDTATHLYKGFPGLSSKESTCQCRTLRFDPWVRKIPWRKKWQPTPVFLPGESRGQRSLAGCSPRDCKESDTTEQLNNNKEAMCCIGFSIQEGRLKSQIFTKNLPVMQETRV